MTSSSCRNIGRNSESRKSKVKYHGHLVANDVAIRTGLTNTDYALELHVEDPDGHVVRFGSKPE